MQFWYLRHPASSNSLNGGKEVDREVLSEYTSQGKPLWRLYVGILLVAFCQMEIYYFWFRATQYLATQMVAVIFQSSVAIVYVLSVIFLKEPISNIKVTGVFMAIGGLSLTTFGATRPNKGIIIF